MRILSSRRCALLIVVLLVTQACLFLSRGEEMPQPTDASMVQPVSSATALAVTPTAVTQEEHIPEEDTDQEEMVYEIGEEIASVWAVGARASSNEGDGAYQTSQALGQRDTLICGDFVTAWQPAAHQTEAWIELDYFPYVLPKSIHIYQSFNIHQISMVELVTLDHERVTVFDFEHDGRYLDKYQCPTLDGIGHGEVEELIRAVRITLARNPDEAWTQIDAVGVSGFVAGPLPEPIQDVTDFPDQTYGYGHQYFSNKNNNNALVFEGERLWTGSNGGVLVWYPGPEGGWDYVQVSNRSTYALAYCNWEPAVIFSGGDWGVSEFPLAIFFIDDFDDEYRPSFRPIDHPGDESFGRVMAMACDDQNRQLWVGYAGVVSRYDADTQTWQDFDWRKDYAYDSVRKITLVDGDVWVGTGNGVAVLYGGNQLEVFTTENSDLPCKFVHRIESDDSGVLWMASTCGLLSYDGKTWKTWTSREIEGGLLADGLPDITKTTGGRLWLGDTFGTLCEFDPVSKKCQQVVIAPDYYLSLGVLQVDAQGRLALSSYVHGLHIIDQGKWSPLVTKDQILSNDIRAIAVTPDKKMWLAHNAGMQTFHVDYPHAPWETVALPSNAQAYSFLVADDGLWIGYNGGARFIPYLEGQESFDLPLAKLDPRVDNTVMAIGKGADGLMYFGLSTGLYIWDGSELQLEDLLSQADQENDVLRPRVNRIYADGEDVWVGTSRGLHQFVNGELRKSWMDELREASSFYSSSVGVIAPSPRGEELLVGIGRELFLFDRIEFDLVLELPSVITNLCTGTYQLWLTTDGSGMFLVTMDDTPQIYWDDISQSNYPNRFGYQALTMSDMGTLWIGSKGSGLILFRSAFTQ